MLYKGGVINPFTCMPCGFNKTSSCWQKDRVQNLRVLMRHENHVFSFDRVFSGVSCPSTQEYELGVFVCVKPLSMNREGGALKLSSHYFLKLSNIAQFASGEDNLCSCLVGNMITVKVM